MTLMPLLRGILAGTAVIVLILAVLVLGPVDVFDAHTVLDWAGRIANVVLAS
jgi:hypothetical protein